jgi:UDP-glucose 4-epimerase
MTHANVALITGGLGLIGSFIARRLVDDGLVEKVVLLDHYGRYVSSTRREFVDYRKQRTAGIEDKIVIERGEAKYFSVMFDVLNRHRPRYIFHLAALPLAKLQNINTQEALEGSVQSTSNILEIAGMLQRTDGYKPSRFVYASSSMVYGDFQYLPADEKHQTEPKEVYGTMKLAGEDITRGLSRCYGIDSCIVRPSAVYGPTDMNRRVSQIFVEKAMLGSKISVHGADEALDFTYVKDTAMGFVLAATHDKGANETFNITHGGARTLLDLVLVLKKHFPKLTYDVIERDHEKPKRGTLSIDKAKEMLGYQPKYDLETGVAEYVEYVRKNNPVLAASSS